MRRILATLVAASLLMVLVAGSTTAATSRLVRAHALVALYEDPAGWVPVGWIDADLTTPTVGDPSPGVIEFTPLANSVLPPWMAIAEVAGFYWSDYDPDFGGSFPGASAPSMQCVWEWPGTYDCADIQIWMLDQNASRGQSDWFVTAPVGDETNQTWYQVIKGDIEIPASARVDVP